MEHKNKPSISEVLEKISFPVKREMIINPAKKDTGMDMLFRGDNGEHLGVVSRDYKMVPHQESVEKTLEALKKEKVPVEVKDFYMSGQGARIYLTLRFRQEMEIIPGSKDLISPGAFLTNSYDRSLIYELKGFITRLVCWNGMTVMETLFGAARKHTKNLDIELIIAQFIKIIPNFKGVVVPRLREIAAIRVDSKMISEKLEEVPGWLQEETISYMKSRKMIEVETKGDEIKIFPNSFTVWEFINSFTYVLTHTETSSFSRRMELLVGLAASFNL